MILALVAALLLVAGCSTQETTQDVDYNPVVYVAYGGSNCCNNNVGYNAFEQEYISISRTTKEITPDYLEVSEGAMVDLYVYSDTACSFEIPGLGIEQNVAGGTTTKITFRASCEGLYGMSCESDYFNANSNNAAVLSIE